MIIETRQLLANALASSEWDVWTWEPADVAAVPCLVVGRPTFETRPTGGGNLYTLTNPVYAIGRRMNDDDALSELDAVTDQALELLTPVCTLAGVLPTVRTIAENTYPAYRIDCVTGQGYC